MTVILQVGERAVTEREIIPLLKEYQLLPQLLRELILDQAIADYTCSEEDLQIAVQNFYNQKQLTTPDACQAWLNQQQLTSEKLTRQIARQLRIEKFKQATWGQKIESYFLSRKSQLDRVIYSLIRTQDIGIAQELYFRLQAGEETFADLAEKYSQGLEANTKGILGPVSLSVPHPKIAKQLLISKNGQLWHPIQVDQWWVIIRLEKIIPAQLDEPMRNQLLNELLSDWLKQKTSELDI